MEIFELTVVMDDPRYDEFDFEELPSLLRNEYLSKDFYCEEFGLLPWGPVPLKHMWKPVAPKGTVRPFIDYTNVSRVPVFSERAIRILREFLEPNGELLPLITKKGQYSVYNLLKTSDALDVARTKGVVNPSTGSFISVEDFAFDERKMEDLSIFRIRQHTPAVFVTSTFKEKAELAGLNGFYFIKIWPFSEGESWEKTETLRRRNRRGKTEPMKGQCLTILLNLERGKPTEAEENWVRELAFQLEAFLNEGADSIDAEFVGAIDDVDSHKNKARIILACPDVNRLFDKIKPWISNVDWPRKVKVELRFGNRFDDEAKSELLSIK